MHERNNTKHPGSGQICNGQQYVELAVDLSHRTGNGRRLHFLWRAQTRYCRLHPVIRLRPILGVQKICDGVMSFDTRRAGGPERRAKARTDLALSESATDSL